jgi:hypothetical protein
MEIKTAQLIEVHAGKLVELTFTDAIWKFVFENGLQVLSYAGWILFEQDYGAKPLLGSRDLELAKDPYPSIAEALQDASLEAVTIHALTNHTRLEFLRDEDTVSLELLKNSAKSVNWTFIGEDFEESDID